MSTVTFSENSSDFRIVNTSYQPWLPQSRSNWRELVESTVDQTFHLFSVQEKEQLGNGLLRSWAAEHVPATWYALTREAVCTAVDFRGVPETLTFTATAPYVGAYQDLVEQEAIENLLLYFPESTKSWLKVIKGKFQIAETLPCNSNRPETEVNIVSCGPFEVL